MLALVLASLVKTRLYSLQLTNARNIKKGYMLMLWEEFFAERIVHRFVRAGRQRAGCVVALAKR